MSETTEAIKKYWPFGLAVIAAYYLYTRYSGGSSAGSGSGLASALAAQAQYASQANAQALAAQQAQAQDALDGLRDNPDEFLGVVLSLDA